MKILVSGGLGFIGSAVVNHFQAQGHTVHMLDNYTYAADPTRLDNPQPQMVYKFDITQPIISRLLPNDYDYILHLAAETHVDNSIEDPLRFVRTNVLGTANMLEFARQCENLKGFLYFSTDEVFGPAPGSVLYKEWDRYNSGNPYSAAKAGGEELTLAYGNTYKLPIIITHTMNAFGPSQHIEKFIPKTINDILSGNKVIIHADQTKTIPGSRFYIHTKNIASAVDFVLQNGKTQDKYNIVGEREVTNLEVAELIAKHLDKTLNYELVDFHSSRPGHDLRYGLDGAKLAAMGWKPEDKFEEGLRETVDWYVKQLKEGKA